jgi:apolipoprotein D and lipocalin family protein
MRNLLRALFLVTLAALAGCVGIPKGITPVANFDAQRYMGKWYEIARLEHSSEKGLSGITAHYSLRNDGGIDVVNRGYNAKKDEWRVAQGKAYPVENPDTGYLKVSFFGPFYGSYVIFDVDRIGYEYAFVTGPDRRYLWFLSRTPVVTDEVWTKFIDEAGGLGFDLDKLIRVDQSLSM